MKLFNYDTLFHVMEFVEDATDRFCEQEKNRYNNNIDVQAILPEKCYKKIYSEEDQEDRYKGYVTSPIRILYTFGNVEEVKEYSVTPLCENEEFISEIEIYRTESDNYPAFKWFDETVRLTNEAFRILFGEKLESTIEEKKNINEQLTMAN